jgi:hypothetical protein
MMWFLGRSREKNPKLLPTQQQKVTLCFAQMSSQVQLAHHVITHWIHMGDIRGMVTTHKGFVTANDVVFGSEKKEKSKTFTNLAA